MNILTIAALFLVGMGLGAWLANRYFKGGEVEVSVEQAIKVLKDKGYWVNLNVKPK